ncbi:MAG: AbiH family protein [Bilifractor sp.]
MNERTLYILGNGFDLHFHLPTKTSDYEKYLSRQFIDGVDALEYYANLGVNWSSFEEKLSGLDLDELAMEIVEAPDYLDDHESVREDTIYNVQKITSELLEAKDNALMDMLKNAEEKIKELSLAEAKWGKFLWPKQSDVILTFNYTDTVERLYGFSGEILHIHGNYTDGEKLVFGYKDIDETNKLFYNRLNDNRYRYYEKFVAEIRNDTSISDEQKEEWKNNVYDSMQNEQEDYYINSQYEEIVSFYERNRKEFQIEKLKKWLMKLHLSSNKIINTIAVVGHSMGDVDAEYFNVIEKILNPSEWKIFYYSQEECDVIGKRYSFRDKITFIDSEKFPW